MSNPLTHYSKNHLPCKELMSSFFSNDNFLFLLKSFSGFVKCFSKKSQKKNQACFLLDSFDVSSYLNDIGFAASFFMYYSALDQSRTYDVDLKASPDSAGVYLLTSDA